MTLMVIDHMGIEDILEEEDITRKEVEHCWKEKTIKVEVIQGEEDPLMMEDPQEMEDHQEDLEDKDHQAHQDLLDQYAQ